MEHLKLRNLLQIPRFMGSLRSHLVAPLEAMASLPLCSQDIPILSRLLLVMLSQILVCNVPHHPIIVLQLIKVKHITTVAFDYLFSPTPSSSSAADVRDYDAVSKAISEADPIDVLIVNQGVFVPQELEKQELEVKFMIDVNLMGSFHMIKAALLSIKNNRTDRGPASLVSSQAGQVGIYGYTAYSTRKFGLRGLAKALQQEVIADDIHVSLIFPLDTDTPGLVEENKLKPQQTSIIAASSGAMKADEVAKIRLSGIKSGSFIITCNFEGRLLSIATAGLAPQRSYLMAFVEIVATGMVRFAALCFQWNWYGSIEKWDTQNRRT